MSNGSMAGNVTNITGLNDTSPNWCHHNEECLSPEDYLDFIGDYVFPKPVEWVLVAIYAITFILGITGNSMVCFAIWRNKNMRTVTNIFIVNLAVADLVVIWVCLIPTLIGDITNTWFMGFVMCKIVLFLQVVSVSVSVLTLSAISVERWYAICFPLIFKSTKKRAKIIISGIWIFSILIALPELIVANLKHYFDPEYTVLLTACRPSWPAESQTIYQISLLVVLYLAPMILMGFTYSHIAIVLWRGNIPGAIESARKPMVDSKMNKADEQLGARRKAAKMLITVVILFGFSYFPVHLLNILRYTKALNAFAEEVVFVYAALAHWLPYFNSSINPVIYNFMSAKFRKEFILACTCCTRLQKKRRIRGRNPNISIYSNSTIPHYTGSGRTFTQTEQITLSNFHY